MNEVCIRSEQPGDIAEITRVTELAFRTHRHSDQTEHFIILALRGAGALTVSLVAEKQAQVVGHVAFSPVRFSDGSADWYGLGPIAVLPEFQHQGIGKALINSGLSALRGIGAAGCVVLGDPNYYKRFGFENRRECVLEGFPEEYFQSLTLGQRRAEGKVTYHEAFGAKS